MELAIEAELYTPSVDEAGNYVDSVPPAAAFKHGVRCPCGSRRDKVYESHSVFSGHTKTKCHQKWLATLNMNKANFYAENATLRTTIHNQRMIIAKLERDLQNKNTTIDFLSQQISRVVRGDAAASQEAQTVCDLLDFD